MSELTFKSAGVGIREIDNSVAGTYSPAGVPACVIGTAKQGPAFVPRTIGSIADFEKIFGPVDETQFGAIAIQQWLKNAASATFVRVLGVGDGSAAANYSGFMVGAELPDGAEGGYLGKNPYAYSITDAPMVVNGDPGRTYALGAFMTDNTGSTFLADSGLLTGATYVSTDDVAAECIFSLGAIPLTELDTITIEDTTGTPHEITLGATETVAALVGLINGDATASLVLTAEVIDPTSFKITQDILGTAGNNKTATMVAVGAQLVPSVADTLVGGVDAVAYAPASITIDLEDPDTSDSISIAPADSFAVTDIEGTIHTFVADTEFDVGSDDDESWDNFVLALNDVTLTSDSSGTTLAFAASTYNSTAMTLLITHSDAGAVTGAAGNGASVVFTIAADGADQFTVAAALEFADGADEVEAAQHTVTVDVSDSSESDGLLWAIGDKLTILVDTDGAGTMTSADNTYEFIAYDSTVGVPDDEPADHGSLFDIAGLTTPYSQWRALRNTVNQTDGTDPIVWSGQDITAAPDAYADWFASHEMTLVYNGASYEMKFTLDAGDATDVTVTAQFSLASNAELSETFSGGIDVGSTLVEAPIIRGMLMTPSGVLATLNNGTMSPLEESATEQNIDDAGGENTIFGTLNSTGTFNIHLNGFKSTVNDSELTVSLDPTNAAYIANVLNTDPLKIQEKGHLLYSHLPIDETLAYPSDGGVAVSGSGAIFLAPGSDDAGESGSLEDFSGRFNHPVSPWVVSQSFGSVQHQLFRFHHKNDGVLAQEDLTRISISNLKPSSTGYPTFTVAVQKFNGSVIQTFSNLSLDPKASNYIAAIIGDKHEYYNLDKATPQLADIGTIENINSPIRVEMAEKVSMSLTPQSALPFGHEAYSQLKAGLLTTINYAGSSLPISLAAAVELPVPFRMNILGNDGEAVSDHDWGTQFTKIQDIDDPNKSSVVSPLIENIAKYMPSALITSSATYNKSDFTLERIEVNAYETALESDGVTTIISGDINSIDWSSTQVGYRRDAALIGGEITDGSSITRFFSEDDLSSAQNQLYAKFSMFLQGGFNGTNIFVEEKAKLMDTAIEWEYEDVAEQHAKNGPTAAAYRTALDVLSSKSDTDFNLLAMPGIRNVPTTKYAIDMVENRFDAMYIMDIAGYNADGRISTLSENKIPNASSTASSFEGLSYDSSFAAAYFPDVTMNFNGSDVVVPASCAVLGAFSKNDSMAYSWFAPAGFTRGALSDVAETGISFSRSDLDDLYEAKVNPITSFPGSSIVVWGQKTLLQAPSSLDRVNVRRLLIYIRRRVREIALGFLFEPNREETLAKFQATITPLLTSIQANNGVERFKVKIDTDTTTQIDVENNTLRGKIYIQPTLTAEFISLDFVVSNTI